MNECPQGTCDGVEKIKDHMITKSTIKWAVGILLSIVLAFATAWGVTQNKIGTNTKDIAVIAETMKIGFENINGKLDDIKQSQITKEDVHEAISKRIH